ncbi:MAG: DDE-type integrase/transposase/recombinase [Synergistales bacterium]|nr:DDE-type integrase/transposase/recombinase [Synergistales bacterium]
MHRRKRRGCTRKDPKRPLYPDLVERNFKPEAPNKLWVGDITQHPTSEGWLYLASSVDAFSRRVIGWSMGSRITSELAVNALNMAIKRKMPQ